MKKLISAALALTLGATFAIGVTACGKSSNKDEESAKDAIYKLKELYDKDSLYETPRDYDVVGKTIGGETSCDVDWKVSWNNTEYAIKDYITVGDMDKTSYLVTISVTKPPVEIEYTLTASVTIGKATESYNFKRKVPAQTVIGGEDNRETTTASISFDAAKANRTSYSTEAHVWEQNGIKVTNNKYNSITDCYDGGNPARFYQGSKLKIEYPGIKLLEVDSQTYSDNDYAGRLESSLKAANVPATITVDDGDLTITLEYAVDYLEFELTGQTRIFAIDITAVVGGASDAEKVAAAKDMTTISQTKYSETGSYDLPAEAYGATLAWTVKETSDLVSVSIGKLVVSKIPAATTDVTLVATITAGNEDDKLEVTISIVPPLVSENDGTPEHPYTIAEAIAIANTVNAGEFYKKDGKIAEICVEGYVLDVGEWSDGFQNWSKVYIGVSPTTDKTSKTDALYVYRLNVDSTYLKVSTDLVVGAKIVVCGPLQNYQGNTPELNNSGSFKVRAVSYTLPA